MPKWNIENYASGNKQNLTPAHELVTKQPDSYTVTSGKKTYTLTRDEYKGVRDLYKTQWADNYGQDDEDQLNKRNGVMPRSFANSYKKGDKSLYDLGLPNSKYFEKYLETYRTAKKEQQQLEASYKAKQTRLNEFYTAVGNKWLDDEKEWGNYNPEQEFADLDELGNTTGTSTAWSNRRQQQFYDLLNSSEWADVRAMYDANRKTTKKPEGEYETPREYYEALYKAEYQNKDFTEEQQAKNIYNVSFTFDDFDTAYNDNLRPYFTKQRFVDETTGLSFTGEDALNFAGKAKIVEAAQGDLKGWVDSYEGDDYTSLIRDLADGGATRDFVAQAKDVILDSINAKEKAKGKTAKERKATKQAFLDYYDKLTSVGETPDRTRLSKKTGEALPDIHDWLEKETGVRLQESKVVRGEGDRTPTTVTKAGRGSTVNPNNLTDIFKKMEEEGYTGDEIKAIHKEMRRSMAFGSQRMKLEAEYYQNWDGGINRYASNLANGFENEGKASSMSQQQVVDIISKLANSGQLSAETLQDEMSALRGANVSSAVIRSAVDQYLTGAARDGESDLYYRGDIAPYVNEGNIDALRAWGYTERSLTSTSGQNIRDALEQFVTDYENDERGALIEESRAKFGDRFDSFEIDQAFSRVGWQDAIPVEQRAMDYFIAYDHGAEVMSGDDRQEAYRYYMLSDEDRNAESIAAWQAMTPEEQSAYIEQFNLEKDFNPILNKSYSQQIRQQFVGAWAKTAFGLIKSAANLYDMTNQWFARSASARFIDDMGRERYDTYVENRQNSIDALRKTHAALSMYGKAQGQDGFSDLISVGSDIFAEILRMNTMSFIGGGIANVVMKGAGMAGLTAQAVTSEKVARGLNRLAKVASSSAFVSDAIGNYWEEAIQEDCTTGQATVYALVCGVLEGAVEALNMDAITTGLLGGDKLADSLIRNGKLAMSKGFRAKCKLIGMVGSALGEGGEEGLSYIASTILGNYTIKRNQFDGTPKPFAGWSWSDLWNDVKMGALVGLFANAMSGSNEFSPEYIICEKMMDEGINPTYVQILHGSAVINSMSQAELNDYRAHISQGDLLSDEQLKEANKKVYDARQATKAAYDQFKSTVENRQADIKKAVTQEKKYATQKKNALAAGDVQKASKKGQLLSEATAKRIKLETEFKNNLPKWQAAYAGQVNPYYAQYEVAQDAIKRHWVAFDSAMATYKMGLSANKKASSVDLELANNYDRAMGIIEEMGGTVTFDQLNDMLASALGMADADENVAPVVADSDVAVQQGEELAQAIREGGAEGAEAVAQAVADEQNAPSEQPVAEESAPVESVPTEQQTEQQTETVATEQTAQPEAEQTAEATAEAEQPAPSRPGQFDENGNFIFGKTPEQMQKESLAEGRTELSEAERAEIEAFANKFGKSITFEAMPAGHNGYYNQNDGRIHLNIYQMGQGNASYLEVAKITFVHELTHSLEKTKSYALLQNLVKKAICQREGLPEEEFETKYVMAFKNAYENAGIPLTFSGAKREAIAHFIEENALAVDSNGASTVKAFADFVARENSGLAGHIFNNITYMLSRIGKGKNPGFKMLHNSQKIWARALKEAGVDMRDSAQYAQPTEQAQPIQSSIDMNKPLKKLSEGTYETADGGIVAQFSLAYAPRTSADIKAEVDRLMSVSSSREEAERWVQSQTSLAALTTQDILDSGVLNFMADDRYDAIKKNSDYKQGTIDFINDCIKRRPFSDMLAEVQRQNPDRVFNATDLEAIRIILEQEGYPVGCVMCFVDDRRQNMGNRAQDFIDILNGKIPEGLNMNKTRTDVFNALKKAGVTYVPNVAELVNYKEFKDLHDSNDPQKRAIYDAFNKFNNSFGMASVRLVEGDAEYKREILNWSPSKVKKVNSLGGLRIFSFSDFEAHHLLDIVQIVQDCAQMGIKIQGYTKVPAFAKAMAATGMKVNRSHIAFGNGYHIDENGNRYINHDVQRDENGKIINPNDLDINVVEGIDPSDPDFIEANGNIGNNIIGISWEHILAAMADPYFHQIIPFHTGLDEARLVQKGIKHWFNFKRFQTEKDASTFNKKENGLYNFKKSKYQCNFYTDVIQPMERAGETITAQSFGERFIQVCEEHGAVPRFWQVLDEYVGDDGKLHYKYVPGYEKLLVDYPMFDADGNYIPQEAVKPNFDDGFNTEVLTRYIENESEKRTPEKLEQRQRTIDRITNEVVNGDSSRISKASDIDFGDGTTPFQHSINLGETFGTDDSVPSYPSFSVNVDTQWANLGQQYGTYDNRRNRMRDANTPKQRTDTQNTSKYFDNYLQNAKLSDEMIGDAREAYVTEGVGTYTVTHLNDLVEEAKGELASEGYDFAMDRMLRDLDQQKVTPKLIVKGEQLLADALERNDRENAVKLTGKLCVISHEAGVALNAFKALRQMGGVGQAAYITTLIDRLNNKTFADRIKRGKMQPLHLEQALFDDLVNAKTDAEVNNALEAIFIDVGGQIPPTLTDALKAWRYTAMLGNPVTHIRNMTGNTLMSGVAGVKDLIAAGLERGFVDQSEWTHAVYNPASDEHKAIRAYAKDSWAVHKADVQGSGKQSFESRIMNYARTSNIDAVNAVEKFVSNALESEDAWSLKNAYVSAFTQYCIAQKLDPNNLSKEDEARAVDYATLEAQKRTFRDPSWIASWLSQTARTAAEHNFLAEILIEGVLPFKKTPVNILRRGIEYSPIGLVHGAFDALVNVKKGKVSAAQAVDEIASGLTGSMLFGLGMLLSRLGALRAHGDDDDDYEQFLEQTGDQQYALTLALGGQQFSLALSQLAPAAIPLFMGASLAEGVDSDTGMSILTTLANAANPMMEMSFLSSLNQALSSYNGYTDEGGLGALGAVGTSILKSYASQYVPTLGGKIANIVDDTKRTSKGFKNSAVGNATWDSYFKGLERKVPGLENTLEESVDVLGRTKQKTTFTDWLLSAANNLVLPANVNVINRDEVDNALIDVFEMTGNEKILPTAPKRYIESGSGQNKQRYDLTASEYTEYSKQYGRAVYSAIKAVMADPKYLKSESWDEKAEMLKKAVENAETTIRNIWKEEKLSNAPRSSGIVFNPATGGASVAP